ncbi:MAG: glycosyltransferase family 2 protein, partial [Methyloceanibacter sp.]
MRLVVQIPCLNEEENLPATVADIRAALKEHPHVILVIDDGSTDGTIEAARRAGVDYLAKLPRNRGLARAFMAGISASLRLGADIIVNTDADNQYQAADIKTLIAPIMAGNADIVIGARPIAEIGHFSKVKKLLQRIGSGTIKWLAQADVRDAASGFRAINRNAALRMNVFTPFTYTLETIIQGARSGMKIVSVPIGVGPPTRPSRLFRSVWQYIRRSVVHILGVYTVYAPLRTYGMLGLVPFAAAMALGIRYLVLLIFADPTRSH